MSTAPYDHPLNLLTQSILVYGSYAIALVLLGIAIRMSVRQKTPFFVLIIVAAALGALAEPLYDVGFSLLFYVPGIWSSFTAYNIPQPLWAYSGYVVLYAGNAIFICDQIAKGLTPRGLYCWAGIEFLCSCAFEMIAINGGTFEYWGPHAFRVFHYPLAIGVLESAQVICFSVAAAELRRRSKGPLPLLGLIVLFPCTFYFANFGAGAPLIIALHLSHPAPTLVAITSLVSIGFALALIRGAACLLPTSQNAGKAAVSGA